MCHVPPASVIMIHDDDDHASPQQQQQPGSRGRISILTLSHLSQPTQQHNLFSISLPPDALGGPNSSSFSFCPSPLFVSLFHRQPITQFLCLIPSLPSLSSVKNLN